MSCVHTQTHTFIKIVRVYVCVERIHLHNLILKMYDCLPCIFSHVQNRPIYYQISIWYVVWYDRKHWPKYNIFQSTIYSPSSLSLTYRINILTTILANHYEFFSDSFSPLTRRLNFNQQSQKCCGNRLFSSISTGHSSDASKKTSLSKQEQQRRKILNASLSHVHKYDGQKKQSRKV